MQGHRSPRRRQGVKCPVTHPLVTDEPLSIDSHPEPDWEAGPRKIESALPV